MKNLILALVLLWGVFAANGKAVENSSDDRLSGQWTGQLEIGNVSLNLVFNFPEEESNTCTVDSPDQGAYGIEATFSQTASDKLEVSISAIMASYSGTIVRDENGVPTRIEGTFDQSGMALPLTLKPGAVQRLRPQTPQPPYSYEVEEVTFHNGDVVLAGSLVYPSGYENAEVPVVLMVSGSGQQNRDEELFEHKPFAVIADYLARHGIASLRYDDRGVGGSSGDPDSVTIYSNAEDALRGVKYLKSSGKFSKVGVLGHSEGGSIAFMLGGQQEIDFIVSLAGATVPGREILVEQSKKYMSLVGVQEEFVNDYGTLLDKVIESMLLEDRNGDVEAVVDAIVKDFGISLSDELLEGVKSVYGSGNLWLESFIAFDPKGYIEKVSCPVFAVVGSKDVQVIAQSNIDALKSVLGDRQGYHIKIYEDLNHLFQHCSIGIPEEYVMIEETFAPEVLEDMAEWISEL